MASDASLNDLCKLIVDCPHSTPKWTESGVVVLRSHNIRGGRLDLSDRSFTDEDHYKQRSRRAELRSGDLVLTREAPMGEVCMVPDGLRCCLGQRMVLLRPDSGRCDPRFLLFALQSPHVQNQISWSEGTGSTVSNLRIPHLEALRIPTPPPEEQRAIAAVLGSLDDKIEQNRRTGAKLEGLARAVFKAWFVDFEPVKAKAAGATAFPGMPPETFAALPTRFTDSPLGPVPEGWTHVPLGDLVTLQRGKTYKSALKGMPGPYLLGLGSIQRNGGFKGDSLTTYGGDSPDNLLLKPGDLYASLKDVTQSADLLGAVARVPPDFGIGRLTQDTVRLVPRTSFPDHLTYQQLLTPDYRDYCRGCATGTTNLGLSRDDFLSYPIVLPPQQVAVAYEGLAEAFLQSQAQQRTESATLATLRDYLLPRLLSGRVRVASVEKGDA